jgi:hypothetical protein
MAFHSRRAAPDANVAQATTVDKNAEDGELSGV